MKKRMGQASFACHSKGMESWVWTNNEQLPGFPTSYVVGFIVCVQ